MPVPRDADDPAAPRDADAPVAPRDADAPAAPRDADASVATARPPREVAASPAPGATVRAAGLALGYGAGVVLADVDVELAGGTVVGLLGPNGGGKSTFVRALCGELAPRAGRLEVGAPPALVPQTERSRLDYPVSALDVAVLGALPRLRWWQRPGRAERRRARACLERVGLGDRADVSYGRLSGGQRQRVLVARALLQDAPIVVLDEPFTGLDRVSADRLEALVGELAGEGRLVVLATHDLEQARRLHRVLCLNGRQVAWGDPDRVLDRPTLEATFGGAIVDVPPAGGDGPGGGRGIVPPHHHEHDHDDAPSGP